MAKTRNIRRYYKESYREYLSKKWKPELPVEEFFKVLCTVNDAVYTHIIDKALPFEMPFGLGWLRLNKIKGGGYGYITVGGKHVLVRHANLTTGGYYYRIVWVRPSHLLLTYPFKVTKTYTFKCPRKVARELSKKLQTGYNPL